MFNDSINIVNSKNHLENLYNFSILQNSNNIYFTHPHILEILNKFMGINEGDSLPEKEKWELTTKDKSKIQNAESIQSKEKYQDQLIEKIIAGLLVLNQELEIENLYDLVNNAILSLRIELNHNKFHLHLKSISEKNQFNISYPTPTWIAGKINNSIEFNSQYTLDYGSDIDVLPLLHGFLKLNKNVKLHDITEELKKFNSAYKKGDTLRFLSLAISNGLMRATILDEILTVNSMSLPESELDLFEWENQILYGMLVGLKKVTTKNIANLLNVDKSDASNVVYKFIQQTDIDAEITRGGDLVVRNLPKIPPLKQVNDLREILREMLGYLRSNKSIIFEDMGKMLGISNTELRLNLFELIGSGFIRARIGKKQISNVEFMIPIGSVGKLTLYQCFTCENIFKENESVCSECGARKYYCGVCKGELYPSDNVSTCPYCLTSNHTPHILSWLNIRSICPNCRQSIDSTQLKGGIQ